MASWRKGQPVRLVPLAQATGRVLDVYRDMQQLLGVPHIGSFFQFLGGHPRFLDRFWSVVRPIVQSKEFFSCSTRLRANAYTRIHTYFEVPSLELVRQQFDPAASEELKQCIDLFNDSLPMSLLLASLLSESFEGPAGSANILSTPAPPLKPHRLFEVADEESASPAVKAIYADIRSATSADVLYNIYRVFGRWPGLLRSYWTLVKPIAVSELFQYCGNSVREDALAIVGELPGPVEFSSADLAELGMNQSAGGSLTRGTNMFVHSLAAALLNVSLARIAMEGGSVRHNSITGESPAAATLEAKLPYEKAS